MKAKYSLNSDCFWGAGPALRDLEAGRPPNNRPALCSLVFIALLALYAPHAFLLAQDVQVSATTGTDTVSVQEQFQLTITVSGRDAGDAETPRLPALKGFQVVAGPSVSTQFQWINGRTSSSRSYVYILLPEKEGQFTIDPVEVKVGNRIFKTQPLSVRVAAASSQASRPRKSPTDPSAGEELSQASRLTGEQVFVAAELDRPAAYSGQQVTLSYHLYTQVVISGIQLQENPPLTGFWVEDLEVPQNPVGTRRTINGREYLDYVIKKQALFPNAPGRLKLPASTFAISAKNSGDIFGFFGGTETLYRKTREETLEVKPLPVQNRPAGFSNAVGSFNLTGSLDKTEAATGEAVTLHLKLSGRGNLKMIPDIQLPNLPDFTVYSSKHTDNVRPFEGNLIGGDKTWEYVIVPKAPGQQTIPALSISYFDPEKEKYETLKTSPLSLKVVRGADSGGGMAGLSGFAKQNLTRQGTDINFIKLNAPDLGPAAAPIYRTAWFFLLALVPLAINIALLIHQKTQAADAVLIRTRKARRTALQRLKSAQKAESTDPRRFHDEAAAALGGYLADRFGLPEIAVAGDALEKSLTEKSIPEEIIRETLACLQECDFGRFVATSATPEKMAAIATHIRRIVDTLERAGC